MDYQRNLPTPNISTNDVYYKRQLSFYSFNIHRLSDADSVFYTYPQEIAKKGSNEVCSFVQDYVTHHLPQNIKHLNIFCDSCGGQNKNFTTFRYFHYLVHRSNRFESIRVTFPVRGHSYMECDKNMGLINTKTRVELPKDWVQVFKTARVKPSPFKIEEVENHDVRDWSAFLNPLYVKKCPFQSRPIKELEIRKEHPRMLFYRETYNGMWISSIITQTRRKQLRGPPLADNEFYYPPRAYLEKIPLTRDKYDNLQELKRFCDVSTFSYYENLPKLPKTKKKNNKK
ncbi:uncharacterized protein LOC116161205 [Photinus pyralis]|uniref:uncharacterized protein LOC116161205 n=1 Tax=Photinus pyralis TaxID=7054 RepID=UPI00126777F7|nr:uncharacterized protein LOC116161205 [Photinus pyralis]